MYLLILLGVAFATATLFFKQKLPTALLALASFAWYFEAWQSDGLLPFIIFSVGVVMVILEFNLPQTGLRALLAQLSWAWYSNIIHRIGKRPGSYSSGLDLSV